MPRQLNKLSPRKVATLIKPGRHSDGGGLYLVVTPTGAKKWTFLFRWKAEAARPGPGKLREMGLGAFADVPLAKAREKSAAARALLDSGVDPIAAARKREAVPTFGAMCDQVLALKRQELRSEKSVARWKLALEGYAASIRSMRVDTVDTAAILNVLKPMWSTKPEMAQKTRGYLEAVLDAAKARGVRSGENPARWRGHLDHLLPKRQQLTRGHHAALPANDLPSFIRELRERQGVAAWALEFLILTAARTGEVRGARWSEIDSEAALWVVPAERMKAGKEHRVPLSERALDILEKTRGLANSKYLFPGPGAVDRGLSSGAMERVLDRMGLKVTVHGFRSTFRDWAGEATNFQREVAEAALAHTIGDATERAYRRGDALEKRRNLMEAWSGFCGCQGVDVALLQRDECLPEL